MRSPGQPPEGGPRRVLEASAPPPGRAEGTAGGREVATAGLSNAGPGEVTYVVVKRRHCCCAEEWSLRYCGPPSARSPEAVSGAHPLL